MLFYERLKILFLKKNEFLTRRNFNWEVKNIIFIHCGTKYFLKRFFITNFKLKLLADV